MRISRRSVASPFAAVALVSVLAVACGSVQPYAAKIDGERISQGDLETEMRNIAANAQYLRLVEQRQGPVKGAGQATFDSTFTALTLTRLVYFELIERELDRRKVTITKDDLEKARPSVIRRVEGEEIFKDFSKPYQDELIRQSAQLDLLSVVLGEQKSLDAAARAYYDANTDEFAKATASHILLDTKEKADEVRARIAGGQDFGAVAKEVSLDTASKDRNGELGLEITIESRYETPFVDAVLSTPQGDVSQPVQTRDGFHLIKVTSRQQLSFEEAAVQARARAVAANQERFTLWLQEAVKKAKIEVNPKYGKFDTTGDTPRVVPNAAPASSTTVPSGSNLGQP